MRPHLNRSLGKPAADEKRAIATARTQKPQLRFLTCGSIDGGKSTLIGRLLDDDSVIAHEPASESQSHLYASSNNEDTDFSPLANAQEAKGSLVSDNDPGHRFFSTSKRKFIASDAPGRAQFTRNMAAGASTSDLAVVVVDASQGILSQTRRHSVIASLLGINHVVLAVNKCDLVAFDGNVFRRIEEEYRGFVAELGFETIEAIPVSARHGDNVVRRSNRTPWYVGPTLLEQLETVSIGEATADAPFRFPVQYVSRSDFDLRGFAGTVASGSVKQGDVVAIAKSGKLTRVKRIVTDDGDLTRAIEGQAITIVLEDEVEVSRGNMLVSPSAHPHVSDQFAANLVWFDEQPLLPGRSYILRTEVEQVNATVTDLQCRINVDSFAHEATKTLERNALGVANISVQSRIAFDTFAVNRITGAFVLVDRMTNATVAAGTILNPLRRAGNIRWQSLDIDKTQRAAAKYQQPVVLWFTGLSGAGKSEIANLLEKKLHFAGYHTYLLDGDNVRHGLNRDLGFTDEDRVENIRRVAEVARLMADAGLIVLVSFISPFRAERQMAREMLQPGEFVEVFVDTPFEECARRDPKGLYAKALNGMLKNFTGIDSPYEAPEKPEVRLETVGRSPEETMAALEKRLRGLGFLV
ncbi:MULTISPECIES: adenylyl-sulfate kinase [unclassified Rhizobium]|uniref:adenylyl-sulfate kinase n=1 Tax=unclassified Rhizobium TaxID=2613769 RepID=UPI001ADC1CBE|nr:MULTISPECIES: adenylyl-sulfate kinase [unclassified Rhizobium]MBO9098477.1 adenylyl-sulfate kinase [Rhizobium sp. L58/93]MBO9132719.1 adenylyl-sulfate kinase [Rhizobium sp. B209b/85]MBO9168743.1 adenylyl-sulfate kinase [Rhizobium sp. L245/93]MBO9184693.1 adenylyl-sulfate kinase [Rhizobium sp. E27B/91]QXZ84872.1 adenylyl-sulfate kinase [Rhizobium sp. K1/93]